MPKRRTAWSAWNYLTTSQASPPQHPNTQSSSGALQSVALTYDMNTLQHIPRDIFSNVLVTLNPPHSPSPSLTQATYQYRHPLYNSAMIFAQDRLGEIQGKKGVWYAGAWTGYGFHEDGCRSGLQVGERLGGEVGWEVVDAKFMRGSKPELTWKDYAVRLVVMVMQVWISVLERAVGVGRRGTAAFRVDGYAGTKKEL
jgi:predicted NAD/FAD-binding protein